MTRLLIVLGCVAIFALCLYGMRTGWRHRGARQSGLAPLPPVPPDLGASLLAPLTGLYVGTTTAEQWQDRVVAHGLGTRAAATATLTAAGLLIDRQGAEPLFIPAAAIASAGIGSGLAGKVMGAGGLLVIRWRLGDGSAAVELDSGLRGDDKSVYPAWVQAVDRLVPAA
ncbi:MAG: transporter [Actinomycetota bacterium]|nr:transporter [Actinomycetota bacterium]